MKRTIILTIIISFLSIRGYSQQETKSFLFGAGVGFGFFYPTDINNMLYDRYGMGSGDDIVDMVIYFVLNVNGSYFLSKHSELQLDAEWAFSPKMIKTSSDIHSYFYQRFTPALKYNFHIPLGKKTSIYIGAGINWSFLKFNSESGNDMKGNCIGFSGQAGLMWKFSKWAIKPFITANFINANNTDALGEDPVPEDFDLNFTGVQVGNIFYF